MGYQLKEVDLTRHVRTQAGVRYFHLQMGAPIGKHLSASPDIEAKALDVAGVPFETHVKRLETLMQRVQSNDTSLTVDEEAWSEAMTRLDAMTKIAKQKSKHLSAEKRQLIKVGAGAAVGAGIRYALKNHIPGRAVEMGKEWLAESAGATRDSVVHKTVLWASNFAATASGLIGAQQSTHFVEAFNRIMENPAIDISVTAFLAVLISAFIARVRKALRDRRDKKIATARGEILTTKGHTTL